MSTPVTVHTDFFARAALEPSELETLVSRLVGAPVRVDAVDPTPIAFNWGAISTAGVWRVDVHAHTGDGPVSHLFFVKLLRHPRLWPMLDLIPAGPPREDLMRQLPWRLELDLQRAGIADLLPPGLRAVELHAIREYDADHLALWSEFIETRPGSWEVPTYSRVAFLLGRLAARRRLGAAVNNRLPAYCREVGSGGALR